MHRSRYWLTILPLLLSLACANLRGAPALSDAVVGQWRSGSEQSWLDLQIRSDGSFELTANHYAFATGVVESGSASGHWQLSGDRFSGAIDRSNLVSLHSDYSWDDEVVLASDRYLVLRNALGAFEGYSRLQAP